MAFCAQEGSFARNMLIRFVANLHPPFVDTDFEGKGVGGSEGSLILLARELAARGHQVKVYNPTRCSVISNAVEYQNLEAIDYTEECDVLVLFRAPHPDIERFRARTKIFWSTDIALADWDQTVFPFVDHIFCLSEFHYSHLCQNYRFLPREQTTILGLGINLADYFGSAPEVLPIKTGNRLIYCSVPDRGLIHLTRIFPRIQAQVPDAELFITSDFTLWSRSSAEEEVRSSFAGQVSVKVLGNIPRSELVRIQKSCKLMVYPCTYHEGFCLSAAECIAAAAVPVTTNAFALKTTVAESGLLIDGFPGEDAYDNGFVSATISLLRDQQRRETLATEGRTRAVGTFSWKTIASTFEETVGERVRRQPPFRHVPTAKTITRTAEPRPTISVVIPVYNQGKYLVRAISSVLWQLGPEDEIIVVNDASTDFAVDPVDQTGMWHYSSPNPLMTTFSSKIMWLHNKERIGVSASRNRAIRRSRARWIKFLDADDVLAPYALDLLRNATLATEVRVVAGGCHRIVNGRYEDYLCDTGASLDRILEQIPMLPSATFVKRSVFEEVGYFDEQIDQEEDWDLWLRIHEKWGPEAFAATAAPVCYYWISSKERKQKSRTGMRNGRPVREYFRERYGVVAQ